MVSTCSIAAAVTQSAAVKTLTKGISKGQFILMTGYIMPSDGKQKFLLKVEMLSL